MGPDVLWLVPNIIHTVHLWAFEAFNQKHYALSRAIFTVGFSRIKSQTTTRHRAMCRSCKNKFLDDSLNRVSRG